MSTSRSFTEYVSSRFYNDLFVVEWQQKFRQFF